MLRVRRSLYLLYIYDFLTFRYILNQTWPHSHFLPSTLVCLHDANSDFLWSLATAVIESITSHREQQPGFEAMYLIMPTTQNVDRVIRDFSNGKQQYAGAHLFFIEGTSLRRIASLLRLSHAVSSLPWFSMS